MKYGFCIDSKTIVNKQYLKAGNESFSRYQKQVETNINSYKTKGALDGKRIEDLWFPEVEAKIFISHSSKDISAALCLAGYLKKEFNLDSFIDSAVWQHADVLLKIIDDEYSMINDGRHLYSYKKRNRSTSNVHVILTTALAKMMHRSDGFFFINSPYSIPLKDDIQGNDKTYSPWIYMELQLADILLEKTHPFLKTASTHFSQDPQLNIQFDALKKHLATINKNELANYGNNLETLYRRKFSAAY